MLTKNKLLSCFLSVILILSLNPVSALAEGNRDISNLAVDSIVTKNADGSSEIDSVTVWNDFRVNVNFSEDDENGNRKPGLDIQSGDQISVSWSAPEGVSFTGYSNTIDLTQDGVTIAQAVISESGATVTFNDNVDNLQHVKGTLNFTIQTKRTDTFEEAKNGTIVAGEKTKNIAVNPSSDSTPGKFGEKSGAYVTDGSNVITWSLMVNKDYLTNNKGTVTIYDELPDTETLIDDSLQIDLRSKTNKWTTKAKTLDQINALEGYSASVVGNKITITIPAEDLNADDGLRCYVSFKTASSAAAGSSVVNGMKVTHFEAGSDTSIIDIFTGRVIVPNSGGSIEGVPKGTIQINKVVNGTTDPIEGVHFYIYKVASETDHTRISGWYNGQDYVEIVSGSDGVASMANLEDGYYEIEEIPDNLPNWIATTSISENLFVTLSGNAGTKVNVENSVKTTDVRAIKNWENADGTADDGEHQIVYFQLYRSVESGEPEVVSDAEVKQVNTQTGYSSATVTWSDLPQYDNSGNEYTYSVKEVDEDGADFVPEGYSKEESGLIVTNKKQPVNPPAETTEVSVEKVWQDDNDKNNKRPSEVKVGLYRNGDLQETVVLNAAGKWRYSWTDLEASEKWTVEEIEVPSGYTATVKSEGTSFIITNTFTPEKTSLIKSGLPITGDNGGIVLVLAMCVLSLVGAVSAYIYRRRHLK